MRVLLDTSVFLALLIETEARHKEVAKHYQKLKQQNAFFFTNEFVLSELYTRIVYDVGSYFLKPVVRTIEQLQESEELRILLNTSVHMNDILHTMIKFSEHTLSFTDASLVVCLMQYKLDMIFSLDSDFRNIGISIIPE